MTNIMMALVIVVGLLLLIMLFLSLRRPILVKLGVRNIPRRPAQSILIIVGLTLSTIIIISSLSTGDTLDYSVRSQAIEAYGEIDEILSPPLLGTLAQLGVALDEEPNDNTTTSDDATANSSEAALAESNLFAGGLTSVFALLDEGLPGITEARYAELQAKVKEEPLIDGVAPAIIFPTIIRDTNSGQGEPFGFIFAVDETYQTQFDLQTIDGAPVDMAGLRPGVGNIFELATNLFNLVNNAADDLLAQAGLEDSEISEVAQIVAVVGAILANQEATVGGAHAEGSGNEGNQGNQGNQGNGDESAPLNLAGLEALDPDNLPDNLSLPPGVDLNALLSETAGEGADLNAVASQLLSTINLNTLGSEIDRILGQVGLSLRQGDIYLNRIGAEKLNARVGDVLEIHIGPIPLPYRVKGIVDEAGPMAALAPVVVMPLSEAQQLLFMEGKVNTVLISNQGDSLSGLQHTSEVNERLRVLALSDDAVADLAALLRQPAVRSVLEAAIAKEVAAGPFDGDPPPAFIANLLESFIPFGQLLDELTLLQTELDKSGLSDELRQVLAGREVQFWLLDLEGLPTDLGNEVKEAVQRLTELELLEPLSKQTVVTAANVGGLVSSSIFSLFGIFSIIAAMLLIFMIFVMLAAERRSEMGIARAIGVQRRHLIQMFVSEGVLYDLIAAALGVALGLAISYTMIEFIGGIFNDVAQGLSDQVQGSVFSFRFQIVPSSVIIAYCLGVLLTFIVVTVTSWHISRLNIVAAIRDLPESAFTKRASRLKRISRLAVGPILLGAGLFIIFSGETLEITRTQLGASVMIVGLSLLIGRLLARTSMRPDHSNRLAYSLMGLGLLTLWVVPWSSLLGGQGAIFRQDPRAVLLSFTLSGPLIILGAILTVMFNADALLWFISYLLGGIGSLTPVLKTAIAYPLNARFRTGIAMLLFAMIITTVTIMAIVIEATQAIVTPDNERYAGFEIQVSPTLLSFFNPINDLAAEIERHPDFPREDVAAIARISSLDVAGRQLGPANADEARVQVVGLNEDYIEQAQEVYSFQMRAAGYDSDATIWQALRERDDVAIISPDLIAGNDSFGHRTDEAGDEPVTVTGGDDTPPGDQGRRWRRLTLTGFNQPEATAAGTDMPQTIVELRFGEGIETDSPANGRDDDTIRQVQIIGVLAQDTTLAGGRLQANDRLIEALMGEPVTADTFYLKVKAGADVKAVAQATERAFVSGGLNATLMAEAFAAGQAITRGILQLFQGFMALGLLVGIAALGVISSRTVVERRQQVGMLRAIGYQPYMITLLFLLESSFIAICGLGIGAITGLVLGQNIVAEFYSLVTEGQAFAVPWLQIGLILLGAYLFSMVATILPAYQASRIYPAEALRYS